MTSPLPKTFAFENATRISFQFIFKRALADDRMQAIEVSVDVA